jgi:hypothetical protein
LKDIYIPQQVVHISDCAFLDCSSLRQVNLPNTLTTIGKQAFDGCDNLEAVYSNIEKPWHIEDITFSFYAYERATLYVAEGLADTYRHKAGWRNFENVVETDVVGVKALMADDGKTGQESFTVSGLKTNTPQHGIYIRNGKKYVAH